MQEHRENAISPRLTDILARIRGVFAQKGFDGASMQDLARAAGMSAGNFYRYFSSKSAIVEAMIALDLSEVEKEFAEIMRASNPRQALLHTISEHIRTDASEDGPLWAEIEAAASRRPEIAEIMARMETAISKHLIKVFALLSGLAETKAADRFKSHAQLIVVIVKGSAIGGCGASRTAPGVPSEDFHALVMRTIDHLLDNVINSSAQRGAA